MGPGVGAQRRGPVPERMSDENVCVCVWWLHLCIQVITLGTMFQPTRRMVLIRSLIFCLIHSAARRKRNVGGKISACGSLAMWVGVYARAVLICWHCRTHDL